MAGTSEVLQEYLVALGFKTDVISLRKFEDQLGATGKKVFGFGASVAGVVAGVEAATAAFAYSMRKNFFAADLAGSTVQRMQALTFAGKQFGISADAMEGSVTNLARAFRLNPGMRSYAESLTHISTAGRDTTDVMLDLVRSTKGMDEFIGANIMQQFGMGADEYHQMREHLDELTAARQKALDIQKATGVDMEKQRKDIEAYAATMDTLSMRFDSFSKKLMSWSLPATKKVAGALDYLLEGATYAMMNPAEQKEWERQRREKAGLPYKGKPTMTPEEYAKNLEARKAKLGVTPSSGDSRAEFIKRASDALGVPESAIAAQLQLETGASGNSAIGQFNYGNIKAGKSWAGQTSSRNVLEYDAAGKPLHQDSAFRSYSSAASAAEDYASMIKRRFPQAVGAHNATEFAQGLKNGGYATDPDYVNKVTGVATRLGAAGGSAVTQNNTTTINVTGSDAKSTAVAVAGQQTRVIGDAVRMLKGSTS